MRARARNSLLRASAVAPLLTSIKIFLQAFSAAPARRADAEHAPPRLYTDPDGITHRRGCRSLPERTEVDPVVRFRSKKGKCQNLSPAILFWLLFLLSSLSRAPLPPSYPPLSLLSARFPAPKSHHKSALHNSTSRRKRSKGSRIHNIHADRYCAGYPNTGHGLNKLRLDRPRLSAHPLFVRSGSNSTEAKRGPGSG